MKTILKNYTRLAACLLLLGLGLTACSDKFFDLRPVDSFNEASFYQRASDFDQGLVAAYASLRATYRNWYALGDVATDDAYNWRTNNNTNLININEAQTTATNGLVSGFWDASYSIIALANVIIDKSAAVSYDETLRKRYVAEARFLRGLMYFNLVRVFGDVPLVLNQLTTPSQAFEFGRTPSAEVYAQILADLQVAETDLPRAYATNNDVGRATSGSAKALLGKVLLTQRQYGPAVTKLREVTSSGTYSLVADYAGLFNPDLASTPEDIFKVQYARAAPGMGSPFGGDVAPNEPTPGKTFLAAGGIGRGFFHMTTDLRQAFTPGDRRFATVDSARGTRLYYVTKKYFDPKITVADDAGNDWYVLRYADVLLMLAEALNEGGNSADALIPLNQVRARAGLPALTATTQADLRQVIERERRLELYHEGHRWFDLLRTGRLTTVMNAHYQRWAGDNDQVGQGASLQEFRLLFPLPKFQVDLNPTKLIQNPGY